MKELRIAVELVATGQSYCDTDDTTFVTADEALLEAERIVGIILLNGKCWVRIKNIRHTRSDTLEPPSADTFFLGDPFNGDDITNGFSLDLKKASWLWKLTVRSPMEITIPLSEKP